MKVRYRDILDLLKARREKVLSGGVNCIPSDFRRFSNDFPGVEQGMFYCVTANTKAGKSQLANFMFVYNPLLYMIENPDKVRVMIYYFNLEESATNIVTRALSRMLHKFSNGRIRQNSRMLKSVQSEYPLDLDVLNCLESEPYVKLFDFMLDRIDFRKERTVSHTVKVIEKFCESHGHWVMRKPGPEDDPFGGDVRDRFVWDDPDLYFICIFDHLANLDSENGESLKVTIDRLCKKCVALRNDYNIIPVAVMQQALAQESLENIKAKKLRPSTAGLGDSKTVSRDFNMMLGLFDPFRFELEEYAGYDVRRLRNHVRFLEMLLNREGEAGSMVPLFFDGDTNTFMEMPKAYADEKARTPNPELEAFYRYVEDNYINRRPGQAVVSMLVTKHNKKLKLWKLRRRKMKVMSRTA